MITAACVVSLSMLIMALWPHWIGGAVGVVGTFGAMGMWRPSFQALQMQVTRPEWRSMASGIGAMGMSMGFSVVSYSGGYVADHFGYKYLFSIGAMLALTSAAVTYTLVHKRSDDAGPDGACCT